MSWCAFFEKINSRGGRLFRTGEYVYSILTYGCETWVLSKGVEKRIRATEMWFFRRIQKIPWTAKCADKSVLMEVNRNATLMNKIRTQQARLIGYVIRRHSLERLVTTAKIEGKRARGRQRDKILDGIALLLGKSKTADILKDVEDLQSLLARNLKKKNALSLVRCSLLFQCHCYSLLQIMS